MRNDKSSSECGFEPLLDSQDVAHLMGVQLGTVKLRARTGEIPGIKPEKLRRFRASVLGSYVKETIPQWN
jgi:hypothetical protein